MRVEGLLPVLALGKVSGKKKSNISICITVNMEDICKVKSKKKKEDGNQEA